MLLNFNKKLFIYKRKNNRLLTIPFIRKELNKITSINTTNLINDLITLRDLGFIDYVETEYIILSKKSDRGYNHRGFYIGSYSFTQYKKEVVKWLYNSKKKSIITQEWIAKILNITQATVSRIVSKLDKIYIFEEVSREQTSKQAIEKLKELQGYFKVVKGKVFKLIGTRLKELLDNKQFTSNELIYDGFQKLAVKIRNEEFVEYNVIISKNIKARICVY